MFDLEQSISKWRKQMLAAGIKTPVPLEELEIHLREEIEQQTKSGLNEQEIFNSAIQKMGQAGLLKTEFVKAKGLLGVLGDNKTTRIHRILAVLWLACFSWGFLTMTGLFISIFREPERFRITPDFFVAMLLLYIYLRGILGSILLFRGKDKGRRSIRIIAFLGVIACIAQIMAFRSFSVMAAISTVFILASIWFLRPPKKEISKPAGN